jgi:uncharacterized protein YqeY
MLIKQIKSKCLELRKSKSIFASSLQTVIGEVEMVAKNKQQEFPTDEQCIVTLKRFCDKIDETIALITDQSKIEALQAEKAIYEQFVPKQLSQSELIEVVKQFVSNNPGSKMGQIMAHLKANYAGLYDGKMASDVIKTLI